MIRIYADLNCPFCYALSEWIDEAGLDDQIEWCLVDHKPSAYFEDHHAQTLIELTEEIFVIRQRASDIQIRLPQGRTNVRKAERLLCQVKTSHPTSFLPLKQHIYRAYWAEDSNIEDDSVLQQLLKKVGLNNVGISPQSSEQIAHWTREWEEGPFDRRLPAIQRSENDFSLGLASKNDTLRYIQGQSGKVSESTLSCQYQIRPQVAIIGDWASFWDFTKTLRHHNDLIFQQDLHTLDKHFKSSTPPEIVLINYLKIDLKAMDALQEFCRLCEQYHCPLLLFTDSLTETQELTLLQLGCSDVISQKSVEYAVLKINRLLKNKSIFDQLRASSLIGSLTQLNNRRSFISTLEKEWASSARSKQPLSLLMLDIDHFKAFNDHFGHLAGDGCLRQVAGIIKSQIHRLGDMACRYGGEEFAVILPNTDAQGAQALAEEILNNIRQAQIANPMSELKILTASIGISSFYYQSEVNTNGLIEVADQQLYRAKSAGRNRVRSQHCPD